MRKRRRGKHARCSVIGAIKLAIAAKTVGFFGVDDHLFNSKALLTGKKMGLVTMEKENRMYVIVRMRDFYNEGTRKDIVAKSEWDTDAMTFATKAEAKREAERLHRQSNTGIYYLAHNEYGRAAFVARHVTRVHRSIKKRYWNLERRAA